MATKPANPVRAAIYVRISRDPKATEEGISLQKKRTTKLCADQGWSIFDVYEDNDRTAADAADRPGYTRLLHDIGAGMVDVVVVTKEDRLHRDMGELSTFVKRCKAAGMLRVVSVKSGETSLTDPSAVMILEIKASVGAYEVANTRDRVKDRMQELAEQGLYSGGTRPYSYEADGVTIRESEAFRIREAADKVIAGSTLYSIVRDWNDEGVGTVKGKRWSVTALKQVLLSPRIAGLRVHQGEVIGDAVWDGIIDRRVWDHVGSILRAPSSRRLPRASHAYPLRGVLRCSECGGWLHAVFAQGVRNYACRKDAHGCGRVSINADKTEAVIFPVVLKLADMPDMRNALRAEVCGDAAELASLIAANERDEVKLAEALEMYDSGEMDRASYGKLHKVVTDRVQGRVQRLSALHGQSALDRLGGSVRNSWDGMSAEDKRLITLAILDHVEVKSARKRGGRFDPQRLLLVLRFDVAWGKDFDLGGALAILHSDRPLRAL
jgi:site-specific DNA recombinase